MENDFLHSKGDNVTKFGWRPQEFNVSSGDKTNPYGKDFEVQNLELNPLKDPQSWSGESEKGGDAGLKLWVRGDHSHGYVSSAELASVRADVLYGSVRVGMKLGESGTCGAFFFVCHAPHLSSPYSEIPNFDLVLQQLPGNRH